MRFAQAFTLVAAAATAAVQAVTLPPGVPRNLLEFRDKHAYEAPRDKCRRTITIRASEDDDDDVSEEFEKGVREANNGGTLYLPKGETYIIGKALDLTGLNDIHVHLEGEIKVCFLCFLSSRTSTADFLVHQRRRVLARECFLPPLPEVHHVLEMGRRRHQDLRRGCHRGSRVSRQFPENSQNSQRTRTDSTASQPTLVERV